jgi:hypothetical protein
VHPFFPKAAYSTIALEDRVTTICRRKKSLQFCLYMQKTYRKNSCIFTHFYSELFLSLLGPLYAAREEVISQNKMVTYQFFLIF